MGASSYLKAFAGLLLITNLVALPVAPETELIETRNSEEVVTLATELKPPPLDQKDDDEEHGEVVVYLINVFAVKNDTAETSGEALDDDVIENHPEMMQPLVSVLLVLEVNEDNSNDVTNAVDLKELADELIKEGFRVERIQDGNETKLLRVNLEDQDVNDVISSTSRTKPKSDKTKEKKKKAREEEKIRRKRTICIKCQNDVGGYPGGGNYYPENPRPYPSGGSVAVLPVIAVPIAVGGRKKHHHHEGHDYYPPPNQGNYPQPPPVYPQPPPVHHPQPRPVYPVYPQPQPVQPVYHPQPGNGCNTCNNGGGGGSSAHAEASASAHASSW